MDIEKKINDNNIKMPVRQLDFSRFKHITNETLLDDDELNLLGSIFEKDFSIRLLECLLIIFCVEKITSGPIIYNYVKDDNYCLSPREDNYIDIYEYDEVIDMLDNIHKKDVKKLLEYDLFTKKIYRNYESETLECNDLCKSVLREFLNSETSVPLIEKIIKSVDIDNFFG